MKKTNVTLFAVLALFLAGCTKATSTSASANSASTAASASVASSGTSADSTSVDLHLGRNDLCGYQSCRNGGRRCQHR
jgi:outer membrane lipoprotein SlyB